MTACAQACVPTCVCIRARVYMCISVLFVGSIGMMRCVMKKNEPLPILRACLRLCVHERQEEKIESAQEWMWEGERSEREAEGG